MKPITLKKCLYLLKEKFPKFIPYWKDYTSYWEIYEGMTAQMTPFALYVIDVIKSNNADEVRKVFEVVEFLITNGDESVKNGVTTIFLEHLLSKDPKEIKFKTFSKYLGRESIAYCKAWDKFCGVKTEGLWEDKKK